MWGPAVGSCRDAEKLWGTLRAVRRATGRCAQQVVDTCVGRGYQAAQTIVLHQWRLPESPPIMQSAVRMAAGALPPEVVAQVRFARRYGTNALHDAEAQVGALGARLRVVFARCRIKRVASRSPETRIRESDCYPWLCQVGFRAGLRSPFPGYGDFARSSPDTVSVRDAMQLSGSKNHQYEAPK